MQEAAGGKARHECGRRRTLRAPGGALASGELAAGEIVPAEIVPAEIVPAEIVPAEIVEDGDARGAQP
jgi:hypothetical protein